MVSPRHKSVMKIIRQKGMTLIELIIMIAILTTTLTGFFSAVNFANRYSADPMIYKQALLVGQSYLDEIQSKMLLDPDNNNAACPPAAGTPPRSGWDSVCDYGGWTETGITDMNGNSIAGLEDFTVIVQVDNAASLNGLLGPTDVLRIDLVVSHPDMQNPVALTAYRG